MCFVPLLVKVPLVFVAVGRGFRPEFDLLGVGLGIQGLF